MIASETIWLIGWLMMLGAAAMGIKQIKDETKRPMTWLPFVLAFAVVAIILVPLWPFFLGVVLYVWFDSRNN